MIEFLLGALAVGVPFAGVRLAKFGKRREAAFRLRVLRSLLGHRNDSVSCVTRRVWPDEHSRLPGLEPRVALVLERLCDEGLVSKPEPKHSSTQYTITDEGRHVALWGKE